MRYKRPYARETAFHAPSACYSVLVSVVVSVEFSVWFVKLRGGA